MHLDHRQGRWARELLSQQHKDGTWPGWCFHSMALPGKAPLCTEQALRRLHALGFTMDDEPIQRAVSTMAACLRGERKIDTYWEKGLDWAMYEPLMLAAWIRRFDPDNPEARSLAQRWARVAEAGFSSGSLDPTAWGTAYEAEFHRAGKHPQPINFTPLYHAMLLPGMLSPDAENAMVSHILLNGMYYVYPHALIHPPAEFASRETSSWLAALELLTPYACARKKLEFAAAHLCMNADSDGFWDLGAKANDRVYFPLADSWRSQHSRKKDCTQRISAFLSNFM